MKSTSKLVSLLAVVALAACSDRTVEPAPTADVEAAAPAVQAQPQPQPQSNGLARDLGVDAVPFQVEAASVEGNALVTTGKSGFLMYGPYVPLDAGAYRLTVRGEVAEMAEGAQLRIDVASKAGTVSHGEVIVATPMPGQETIADLRFTLENAVSDLEVRANVSDGASVKIYSYQVVAAE